MVFVCLEKQPADEKNATDISNMVFYAQSTITVISERNVTEK